MQERCLKEQAHKCPPKSASITRRTRLRTLAFCIIRSCGRTLTASTYTHSAHSTCADIAMSMSQRMKSQPLHVHGGMIAACLGALPRLLCCVMEAQRRSLCLKNYKPGKPSSQPHALTGQAAGRLGGLCLLYVTTGAGRVSLNSFKSKHWANAPAAQGDGASADERWPPPLSTAPPAHASNCKRISCMHGLWRHALSRLSKQQ